MKNYKLSSDQLEWSNCPEFLEFPFVCRLWLWWCSKGPKSRKGGTIGGNKIFDLIKVYLSLFPVSHNNLLPVTINKWNLLIVVDLLDFEIYQHTIPSISNNYSGFMLQEMLLTQGDIFFDIGANHGMFSLYASRLVGQQGRVIAVEPQPRLAKALITSKELNQLEQISIFETAVGNQNGQSTFSIPKRSSGVGSLFKEHTSQSSTTTQISVEMKTLDKVAQETEISQLDLIKVDVEGAEFMVFQGSQSVLLKYKPFLWFEINPDAQRIAGVTSTELLNILRNFGYCKFYQVSSLVRGECVEPEEFPKLTDVLAVHVQRISTFDVLKNSFWENLTSTKLKK